MRILLLCLMLGLCVGRWDASHVAAQATPTPRSQGAAALTAISASSFLDAQDGWLLGSVCPATAGPRRCTLALRRSQDGGKTWSALPAPQLAPDQAQHLHFASRQIGWLFGPGLAVTRDGGQTWARMSRAVSALASVGPSVWAIEQRPGRIDRPVTGAVDLPEMHSVLIQSSDLGATWQDAPVQPAEISAFSQLLRTTARQAWVVTPTEIGPWILTTADGARSWRQLPNLMLHMQCGLDTVGVGPAMQLWLMCGGDGATAMQSKRLMTSPDAGRYWTIPADNMFFQPPIGALPSVGFFLSSGQLAVISETRAFLGLARSTLFVTNDGGQTWDEAIPSVQADPDATGGIQSVAFADTRHGWALTGGRVLFRTSDGGRTWQTILVDPLAAE